jgi:hypothetical protein
LDTALLGLTATALLAYAGFAFAYRPFDSTDADVAKPGELEVELGPVQWLRENGKRFLQVPAVIANFGLERERELVIEGRHQVALDPEPGEHHSALVDNAVSIKQVLRRGVLQDEPGPSIATEYGVLLPDVHGRQGTGASVAGIVSQRGDAGTAHLNGVLSWTREHEPGLFLGVILEGSYSWPVRPVAEVFTDQARGTARVNSGLVGAIWRVRDGLSFDVGVRSAKAGDDQTHEVRLGLTWAFAFKNEP